MDNFTENDLSLRKNLGITTINWLRLVGINTFQELQNVGAAEAYTLIIQRGIKASKTALYALHGAIVNEHWTQLDPVTKNSLVVAVDEMNESLVAE